LADVSVQVQSAYEFVILNTWIPCGCWQASSNVDSAYAAKRHKVGGKFHLKPNNGSEEEINNLERASGLEQISPVDNKTCDVMSPCTVLNK
jgi:hypothetical protein